MLFVQHYCSAMKLPLLLRQYWTTLLKQKMNVVCSTLLFSHVNLVNTEQHFETNSTLLFSHVNLVAILNNILKERCWLFNPDGHIVTATHWLNWRAAKQSGERSDILRGENLQESNCVSMLYSVFLSNRILTCIAPAVNKITRSCVRMTTTRYPVST